MSNSIATMVTAALAVSLGVVDQIHGDMATVEVGVQTFHLPLWVFPCEVTEGDEFHYTNQNGVFQLRCGKPGR